jgi:hypothetical protein
VGVAHAALDDAARRRHGARGAAPGGRRRRDLGRRHDEDELLRPALGRVVASGRRLHRTASMAFCEGSLVDAGGELVAHATGTFKYLKGLPAGGKRIQRLNASD